MIECEKQSFWMRFNKEKMSIKLNKQPRTRNNEVAKIVTKPTNLSSATENATIWDDQVKCVYLFYLFLVSSLDNNFDK